MENYRVTGESREVGAIGIFETFIENVATESSQDAYNEVRESMYANHRDHVLIKEIRLVTDCCSVVVEPRAYL